MRIGSAAKSLVLHDFSVNFLMKNILFLAGLPASKCQINTTLHLSKLEHLKFVIISSNAFQWYCHVRLLVLKAFLKDFERFRLAQCSIMHLFPDCFAADSMNGSWGHNIVVTYVVCSKRNTLL